MPELSSRSFEWLAPTRVIFGPGTRSRLRSVVDEVAGESARVFLVTGRHNLRAQGTLQEVLDALGESRVTLFDEVTPFPSPDLVDSATEACRAASADVVVGIGGGSPLDLAKAVAVLATHEGTAREYAIKQKSLQRRGLPFVALPTTSGSSSEVTIGAAMWDMEAKQSMSVRGPLAFPTVAIVDPELTLSMPRLLAANTGMDAFTSAFESYWSTDAQPMTDALHLEVIKLFSNNLERSCNEGDLDSRSACALAATVAGVSYSNSRANVCHAVGSPLTLFWNVEHGQSVAVGLPPFLRWNAETFRHRQDALWDALGVGGLDEAVARITEMTENIGLESRLSGLGLGSTDMDTLMDNIRWDLLETMPRPIEPEEARAFLQGIL